MERTMPTASDNVINDVLSLPADARLRLVEKLLLSLNLPTRRDIDKQWADEAERRVRQIDNHEVALIPGEKVFAKIRQRYGR
jgi:putative addiction module component (TIGR02574 family)